MPSFYRCGNRGWDRHKVTTSKYVALKHPFSWFLPVNLWLAPESLNSLVMLKWWENLLCQLSAMWCPAKCFMVLWLCFPICFSGYFVSLNASSHGHIAWCQWPWLPNHKVPFVFDLSFPKEKKKATYFNFVTSKRKSSFQVKRLAPSNMRHLSHYLSTSPIKKNKNDPS